MMRRRLSVTLTLAVGALMLAVWRAAAAAEGKAAAAGESSSHITKGELTTQSYFPEHPKKKFPAGEVVRVVVGIHNEASQAYNITAIYGSVNMPTDFSMYVQNFTHQVYYQPVAASEELSLEFAFRPDPLLASRDFILSLLMLSQEEGGGATHGNYVFNETVSFTEPHRFVDTDLLLMYATLAGLAALAGYLCYMSLLNNGYLARGKGKKQRKSGAANKSSGGAADVTTADDWLRGTNFDLHRKKRAASLKGKLPPVTVD